MHHLWNNFPFGWHHQTVKFFNPSLFHYFTIYNNQTKVFTQAWVTNRLRVYCTTGSRPSYPCPQRASCTRVRSLWRECPLHSCPLSTRACRVAPNQSRPSASPHTAHTKGRGLVWRRRSSEWMTATATPTMTLTTKTMTMAVTVRITSLSKPANHSHLTCHLASHASKLHSAPIHRPIRTPPEPSLISTAKHRTCQSKWLLHEKEGLVNEV